MHTRALFVAAAVVFGSAAAAAAPSGAATLGATGLEGAPLSRNGDLPRPGGPAPDAGPDAVRTRDTATTSPATSSATTSTLGRIAGADRYETAVAISQSLWPDGAADGGYVFVASGENFPDALAGGPVGAKHSAPILLVPKSGTLPAVVGAELDRLEPSYISVFGGVGAVSAAMYDQVRSHAAQDTFREAGSDRYETAARLAYHYVDWTPDNQPIYPDTVYIANGLTFADALSGGAAAGVVGAPLLLSNPDSLADWTAIVLAEFTPSEVVLLGGPAALSSTVATQVKSYVASGGVVRRLAGTDRFGTAARVSQDTFPSADLVAEVFLGNGLNFPDALAAAPAVGVLGDTSLLLVRTACAPSPTISEYDRLAPDFLTALGGTGAVSDAALELTPC